MYEAIKYWKMIHGQGNKEKSLGKGVWRADEHMRDKSGMENYWE